mmetsp:Transcript_15959/g.15366  ORF Transcript_15959/g.15366 Transcript_15959/m.15366 type:complete len:166 (+) Transcript_15959:1516-2013(+)
MNTLQEGGIFERGKLQGQGKAILRNDDTYEGEFKDGVFSGKGTMIHKSYDEFAMGECVYVGLFRNNKKEGQGEMICPMTKEKFTGIWHLDQRWNGTMVMIDGSVYEGEWKNDRMHGKGRLTYKTGSGNSFETGIIFEGEFINGAQGRRGKLIYADGSVYSGQVED